MAKGALERWRKKHGDAETAAMVGAGTTGALAGHFVLKHELKDALDNRNVRRTRGFEDFLSKLEPGDILFHQRSGKHSAAAIENSRLPLKESDFMMTAKGDPFYHASIYMGGGKMAEAQDAIKGVRSNNPVWSPMPENLRAYRPSKGVDQALQYAKDAHGAPYAQTLDDFVDHGLKHLFSFGEGPSTAEACATDPQVCTQFVANAYPEIFPKQFDSPAAMRHAKDLSLIARYEPARAPLMREIAETRVAYPLLRNLKYGLGAGALAYGGLSLAKYLAKDGDTDDGI